jgi:hypothetical protein
MAAGGQNLVTAYKSSTRRRIPAERALFGGTICGGVIYGLELAGAGRGGLQGVGVDPVRRLVSRMRWAWSA